MANDIGRNAAEREVVSRSADAADVFDQRDARRIASERGRGGNVDDVRPAPVIKSFTSALVRLAARKIPASHWSASAWLAVAG